MAQQVAHHPERQNEQNWQWQQWQALGAAANHPEQHEQDWQGLQGFNSASELNQTEYHQEQAFQLDPHQDEQTVAQQVAHHPELQNEQDWAWQQWQALGAAANHPEQHEQDWQGLQGFNSASELNQTEYHPEQAFQLDPHQEEQSVAEQNEDSPTNRFAQVMDGLMAQQTETLLTAMESAMQRVHRRENNLAQEITRLNGVIDEKERAIFYLEGYIRRLEARLAEAQ